MFLYKYETEVGRKWELPRGETAMINETMSGYFYTTKKYNKETEPAKMEA